ncbi:LacI family transcriptional regulator [Sphaerisporangium rufum]|uniref:LacI family transcriptional regulator n=1 Tax=Sphaerisporangium rufum TaxID=1381558 RepID=A0A919UZ40_9ACTN|nr:LacI family DNA-binding transcriptional regulator [Sphaerisporangium rufum]GII75852.1 LacI family transcriptional regulator [Sphaerisporangium rufum]
MVQPRSPVITDVAREAGVSHQTVSRVLNDHPHVRRETRARVLAAIDKLGYRRSFAARALATRHTRTLGVVGLDTTLYGPACTVQAIERAARAAGYFVSVVSLPLTGAGEVGEALDYLADQDVDGIVVVAPQRATAQALADFPPDIPAVAVEGGAAGEVSVVCVDQAAGGRAVTEHLLGLGHRTVWHVRGPADWLEADGRVAGWRAALAAAGREVPEVLAGDWSPRSGYEAGRILAARDDVTAVFVASDQMALGLLRAFGERGVRVPEQISVAAFDDIPEAEFFSPPLTTVRQDFAAVGRQSIEVLLRLLRSGGGHRPERVVVPPVLVPRASTAALRHP